MSGKESKENRVKVLAHLLLPITINYRTSIGARQSLVHKRRSMVNLVLPFLNKEELSRAEQWLIEERHSDLWE